MAVSEQIELHHAINGYAEINPIAIIEASLAIDAGGVEYRARRVIL